MNFTVTMELEYTWVDVVPNQQESLKEHAARTYLPCCQGNKVIDSEGDNLAEQADDDPTHLVPCHRDVKKHLQEHTLKLSVNWTTLTFLHFIFTLTQVLHWGEGICAYLMLLLPLQIQKEELHFLLHL